MPKINRYWNSDPDSLVEYKRPETYDLCKSCECINQLLWKEKRLKRALLLARAERYKMREFIAREEGNLCNQMSWSKILRERTYEQLVDQLLRIANLANKLQNKCRAKAEEYR